MDKIIFRSIRININTSVNKEVYYYLSFYRLLKPYLSSHNNLSCNYSLRTYYISLATVNFILVKDVIKCFLKPLFKRLINKNIKRLLKGSITSRD